MKLQVVVIMDNGTRYEMENSGGDPYEMATELRSFCLNADWISFRTTDGSAAALPTSKIMSVECCEHVEKRGPGRQRKPGPIAVMPDGSEIEF